MSTLSGTPAIGDTRNALLPNAMQSAQRDVIIIAPDTFEQASDAHVRKTEVIISQIVVPTRYVKRASIPACSMRILLKDATPDDLIRCAEEYLLQKDSRLSEAWFCRADRIAPSGVETKAFTASIPITCVLEHPVFFLSSSNMHFRMAFTNAIRAMKVEDQIAFLDTITPQSLLLNMSEPFCIDHPEITQKFLELLEAHTEGSPDSMFNRLTSEQCKNLQETCEHHINDLGVLRDLAIKALWTTTDTSIITQFKDETLLDAKHRHIFLTPNAPKMFHERWLTAFACVSEAMQQQCLKQIPTEDVLSFHAVFMQDSTLIAHWFLCRSQSSNDTRYDAMIPDQIILQYAREQGFNNIINQDLGERWFQVIEKMDSVHCAEEVKDIPPSYVMLLSNHFVASTSEAIRAHWLACWQRLDTGSEQRHALTHLRANHVFSAWDIFLQDGDILLKERWLSLFLTGPTATSFDLTIIPDSTVRSGKIADIFIQSGGVLRKRYYDSWQRIPDIEFATTWDDYFRSLYPSERVKFLEETPDFFILNKPTFLSTAYRFNERWDIAFDRSSSALTSQTTLNDPRVKDKIKQKLTSLQIARIERNAVTCRDYVPSDPFDERITWLLKNMQQTHQRQHMTISREALILQSINALLDWNIDHWRSIDINIGFEDEPGIDGGGVYKDWLTNLLSGLADPTFGLFKTCGETGQYVEPKPASNLVPNEHYDPRVNPSALLELFGRLLGQSVIRKTKSTLDFPNYILKHMRNEPVGLDDLKDKDLDLYKQLTIIRNALPADLSAMDLAFCVDATIAGEVKTIALKPHGQDIAVTTRNRDEYIQLYVEYKLTKEPMAVLTPLLSGFWDVVPPTMTEAFAVQELRELLSEIPKLDTADWEQNTVPLLETATPQQRQITAWFWEIVHALPQDQQRMLLRLITSVTNPPPGGFKRMDPLFQITFNTKDEMHLPNMATCFNQITLPNYLSKEALERKLMYLIMNPEFSFQIR